MEGIFAAFVIAVPLTLIWYELEKMNKRNEEKDNNKG